MPLVTYLCITQKIHPRKIINNFIKIILGYDLS